MFKKTLVPGKPEAGVFAALWVRTAVRGPVFSGSASVQLTPIGNGGVKISSEKFHTDRCQRLRRVNVD